MTFLDRLKNVHYSLPYEPMTTGFLYMADGTYEYHHLNEDI